MRRKRGHTCSPDIVELTRWMRSLGWEKTCKLTAATFPKTGRGLLAKQHIFPGDKLARLPLSLLITVHTVATSSIRDLFPREKSYATQQVLAVFLAWERHLGGDSKWKVYIGSLPETFTCPFVLASTFWLPDAVRDKADRMKEKMDECFKGIASDKMCPHCRRPFEEILTYEAFVWAWCVVNTRAVYIAPDPKAPLTFISLNDENCLALAPYVDLFNHHHTSRVKAYFSSGFYHLEAGTDFGKNREIFINYGPHSNAKLFLEYGFITRDNVHDSIPFDRNDIYRVVGFLFPHVALDKRDAYLKGCDFFKRIECAADGLSWDCEAVIYVYICHPDKDATAIKRDIFSNDFEVGAAGKIREVGLALVRGKEEKVRDELRIAIRESRSEITADMEIGNVAMELLEEHLCLLEKCRNVLERE